MNLLLPRRRRRQIMSDYTRRLAQHSSLSPLSSTQCPIFSCMAFQTVYSNHIMKRSSTHDKVISYQGEGGRSLKEQMIKQTWSVSNYRHKICTRNLHSFLSFAHCRKAPTAISLLPKATFTPSIQPNLGLPRTRLRFTSAINTLVRPLDVSKQFQHFLIYATRQLSFNSRSFCASSFHLRSIVSLLPFYHTSQPQVAHLKNLKLNRV